MTEFHIKHLFPTPVWTKKLEGVDVENLANFIIDLQRSDTGRTVSNVGGWQSNNITNWSAEFLNLLKLINESAQQFSNSLGINRVYLSNTWANINTIGNSNNIHDHKGSIVSGAFYVQVLSKNTGNIVFHRDDCSRFFLPEMETYNDLSAAKMSLNPDQKLLVMFPGWLNHSVEPNHSDTTRISISFNFQLEPTIISKILDEEF